MPEILQGNNTEARLLADERFMRGLVRHIKPGRPLPQLQVVSTIVSHFHQI